MAPATAVGDALLRAGVIARARDHRRRRMLAIAAAAVVAGAAAGFASSALTGSAPTVQPPQAVSSDELLAQTPYLGITCANTGCDSLGLSVWLRRPALSVTALVAGQRFRLDIRDAVQYYPALARQRRMFVGYFHARSLFSKLHVATGPFVNWWANPRTDWPNPTVQIRVDYPDGRAVTTRLIVPLQSGWASRHPPSSRRRPFARTSATRAVPPPRQKVAFAPCA